MASSQLMVDEETDHDVSKVSYDVDSSGYVADHETEKSQVPDTTQESDTGDDQRVVLKQRIGFAPLKRLINAILADVLRYVIMIVSVPRTFSNTLADGLKKIAVSSLDSIKQKAQLHLSSIILYIVNNYPFFSTGMDTLTKGLKIYELYIRRHMKCVRRIRRQSKVCSRKSIVKFSCPSEGVNDESAMDEPQPKQRRVLSPEGRESVVLRVYRWFTGPLTPEDYHFSTEETIEEILKKIETESYHSSQDPDYEPHTESEDMFSSFSSAEAYEVEEDNVDLNGDDNTPIAPKLKDVEKSSIQELQRPYHETNL